MIWGKYGLVCCDRDIGGGVANIYSVRLLSLIFLCFVAFNASAVGVVNKKYTYQIGEVMFDSRDALKDHICNGYDGAVNCGLPNNSISLYTVTGLDGVGGSIMRLSTVLSAWTGGTVCPANSTVVDNLKCTCATGYKPDATASKCEPEIPPCTPPEVRNASGVCESPCVAKKGQILSSGKYDWGTNPESAVVSVCDGTCDATFEGSQAVARFLDNGKYHYLAQGQYIYSGFACTGATAKPALTGVPSDTCAAGQIMGQVNGKNICVSNTTGEPQDPHISQPKTSGTTSTTTSNPDGSTTTTTTTNHEDGSTTTTIKIVQLNGDTTVTGTTTSPDGTDPLDGFCKQNPEALLCSEKESKFSGACGGVFSCEGDAIQCAISQEQHKRNCALFNDKTPLSELGDAIGQGTDSGVSENPAKDANRQQVSLPASLSMSNGIGASCMADLSVQVMSSNITVPFSSICSYLEIMGRIVVAMSLLVAARIVSGGIS